MHQILLETNHIKQNKIVYK